MVSGTQVVLWPVPEEVPHHWAFNRRDSLSVAVMELPVDVVEGTSVTQHKET